MKKLISILAVLLLPISVFAADTNVSNTDVKVNSDASYTFNSGSSLTVGSGATFESSALLQSPNILTDYVIKSDSATLSSTDTGKVVISTAASKVQFDLPVSSNCIDGAKIGIKQTGGGNTITIARQASDTIDKAESDNTDITSDGDAIVLINDLDNNDWLIIGGFKQ